jgi:hypothetical protein
MEILHGHLLKIDTGHMEGTLLEYVSPNYSRDFDERRRVYSWVSLLACVVDGYVFC